MQQGSGFFRGQFVVVEHPEVLRNNRLDVDIVDIRVEKVCQPWNAEQAVDACRAVEPAVWQVGDLIDPVISGCLQACPEWVVL